MQKFRALHYDLKLTTKCRSLSKGLDKEIKTSQQRMTAINCKPQEFVHDLSFGFALTSFNGFKRCSMAELFDREQRVTSNQKKRSRYIRKITHSLGQFAVFVNPEP